MHLFYLNPSYRQSCRYNRSMSEILPAPTDLVLIAIMPHPRDMEIARLLGWYRIRMKSAPKVISVDHIAFYQPSSFGEDHRWKVEYVFPVTGHELASRAELFRDEADHPRAREEYFKIQLGAMQRLPRPILAGSWKRLSFLYTTGERLLAAKTLKDLTVRDDERKILWKALRERAAEKQEYKVEDLPKELDDPKLLALFGIMSSGTFLPMEDE